MDGASTQENIKLRLILIKKSRYSKPKKDVV